MNPWWLAVKPLSLSKILLPLVVGLSAGHAAGGRVGWEVVALGLAFALSAQLSIVLLNDFADRRADALHRERFPELLDARVIPEGLLSAGQVLAAGLGAVFGLLATSGALALFGARPWMLALALFGLFFLWTYSFPPIRLNYRGDGELLETLGVGLVLPLSGYYLLAGTFGGYPFVLLVPLVLLALVGALASGLKHEPADRETGKRTFTALYGAPATRALIAFLQGLAHGLCLFYFARGHGGIWLLVGGALVPLWPLWRARAHASRADFRDLAALSAYKGGLQRAGWLVCAGLVLQFLL